MTESYLRQRESEKERERREETKRYKITNMGKFMQNNINICSTKLYPKFIKILVGHRCLLKTTQAFEGLTSLPNM
ncbi:hypothetical protein JHK82_047974 [Glycine max]|nr:hypothetical protein JHK82_047974 [Glycine max]